MVSNTAELRSLLLSTIEGVRSGKVNPQKATAIGNLAGKVIQSARLDLEVIRLHRLAGKNGVKEQPMRLIGKKVGAAAQ